MSCSRPARFSWGRGRDLPWMPNLRLFMKETALPVTEMGPVGFWALRRLASIWQRVDMVVPGRAGGPRERPRGYPPRLPCFEDRGGTVYYTHLTLPTNREV